MSKVEREIPGGIREIPGLDLAFVEPGQSEPVKYGERIIPESFTAIFQFKDLSKSKRRIKDEPKHWSIVFYVRITEHGLPVLVSVTTTGDNLKDGKTDTVQRWQLKVAEQYRQLLLELAIELAITTRQPTVLLRREYNAENMAKSRAMTAIGVKGNRAVLVHPSTITGTLPNGERADFVRFWDGNPEPITGKELRKLQSDIGKSVRQRVTPKFLQEIARVYVNAVEQNLDPITEITNLYKCKHRTAQEWAQKARAPHLGFLPPTTQGKVTIKSKTNRKGTI